MKTEFLKKIISLILKVKKSLYLHKYNKNSKDLRAKTNKQKEIIINRILEKWKKNPSLRLGQLLMCSISSNDDLFYIEDEVLAKKVETTRWWETL